MNRKIIFRGRRIDTDEWVKGDLIHDEYMDETPCLRILPFLNGCDVIEDGFEVNPSTVGQFTGLSDKNGKEIFEGDVVNHVSWTCVVVYGERGSSFGLKSKDGYLDLTVITPDIANMYLEIIGNIHDNPDLL